MTSNWKLPAHIAEHYKEHKQLIKDKLAEYSTVKRDDYFYELCYCLCTPQSKAVNAFQVQQKLMDADFFNKPFIPIDILQDKQHYIRFHNQKAKRIYDAVGIFPKVLQILDSEADTKQKRKAIYELIPGIGIKEASHFLRNIGYRGLAILDRHILKHLINCGVYFEIPKITPLKNYTNVENTLQNFAVHIEIDIDELDLIFWSYETKTVLK